MHGHGNRLSHTAPPPFAKRPFNNLILQIICPLAGTDYAYTVQDITEALQKQLGLQAQTNSKVLLKIRRVDYYATATSSTPDRPACFMQVSSFVPVVSDTATQGTPAVTYGLLYSQTDQGNLSDAAKLSYTLPSSMADIPLNQTSDFTVVEVSANAAFSELRIHLSWSTKDIATPVP